MGHLGIVGTGVQNASTASGVVTLTQAVPVGATVLLGIAWDAPAPGSVPTVASVADTRGNSWSLTPDVGTVADDTVAVAALRCRVTTALQVGDTITVTISGGQRGRWAMQADAFDDLEASPLDQVHATPQTPAPSGASLSTGATDPTSQPVELVYCVFAFGGGRTTTIPPGWTGGPKVETAAASANRALQVTHKYVSAAGPQEGTLTLSSSSTYAAGIATYRAVSADPPVVDVTRLRMTLPLPPEGPPPVVDVSRLRMLLPAGQGPAGEVHVSRLRMRLPAAPGQAPYSGIKARTAGGSLRDVAIYVAE